MENNKQYNYAKTIADKLEIDLPTPYTPSNLDQFIKQHKTEYYRQKDEQMREQIVEDIKIIDFAREIGFTVVKRGKYYSLKEHDSVMINPQKNCYWRNSVAVGGKAQGGSVIDFALNFTRMSMKEIMTEFSSRLETNQIGMLFPKTELVQVDRKISNDNLILPQPAEHCKNVFAYLNKTRGIEPNIIQHFVKNKMLYMDQKHNCVFVSRDDNGPVFGVIRGTNTYRRFVGDIANSDYKKGFYIHNNSNKLFITESVIDAMSVMSILQKNGNNYKNYNYLPLNGATKFDSIIYHIEREPNITEIFVGLDNDKAGHENSNQIVELIQNTFPEKAIKINQLFPQNTKDWNEELLYYEENNLDFNGLFKNKKTNRINQNSTYSNNSKPFSKPHRINAAVAYEMEMD